MEIENSQSDSVRPSEDPNACRSPDTKNNNDCKYCHHKNCKYCFGKLCNHINEKPVVALGAAAAVGVLLGWLLAGKNK